jgi:uncharacterized tellurite resistance protein B-like protein
LAYLASQKTVVNKKTPFFFFFNDSQALFFIFDPNTIFMSISNLYSSGFKTRNRDHFAAIVRVALSDNVMTPEEEAFINRLAIYLEIEEEEVATILENPDSYPINPPATETARLERLYDLTRMVYADKIADASEKALLKRMVIGLGFDPSQVETIVARALELVASGKDEDEFLADF